MRKITIVSIKELEAKMRVCFAGESFNWGDIKAFINKFDLTYSEKKYIVKKYSPSWSFGGFNNLRALAAGEL